MRPTYETTDDRGREAEVLFALAETWGVEYLRTPRYAGADYLISRDGEVKALIEIKCRQNNFGKYPSYMVSLEKIGRLQAAAEVIKAVPVLVVGFTDSIAWIDASKAVGQVRFGGRQDRDDKQDMEPCVYIPMNQFRRLDGRD